jgi:hypothetical protein
MEKIWIEINKAETTGIQALTNNDICDTWFFLH